MRVKETVLLWIALLVGVCVHAQQFAFQTFSVADGLAQSQIYTMLEDERGMIWMGSRGGGLSRFDGENFTTFSTREGLINNYILCLFEDSQGTLWIGTNEGVSYYDGLRFRDFPLRPDSSSRLCSAIKEDQFGKLWFGAGDGVYTWDGEEVYCYSEGWEVIHHTVNEIFIDSRDRLWIGNNYGLHLIEEDAITSYNKRHGLPSNRVRSIAEDAAGRLWICTYDQGVCIFNEHAFEPADDRYGIRDGLINRVASDGDGRIWLATLDHGVARWSNMQRRFVYYDEDAGLCNNHVRSILEDSWGNYWFGTSGGGVSKFSWQRFERFGAAQGLGSDYIFSICPDTSGFWIGTLSKGVIWFDGAEARHFNSSNGFMDEKVKAIMRDCWGRMWFGTDGGGLAIYDGRRFNIMTGDEGLGDTWIKDIVQAKDSSIWVATAGYGITHMVPTDSTGEFFWFEYYHKDNFLPKNRVICLHEDTLGRIWAGSIRGGLVMIDKGSVSVFDHTNGLPNNNVKAIEEDAFGNLWIGTEGNALIRMPLYDGTFQMERISYDQGINSTNVYLLQKDQQGNIWIGTESGLDHVIMDSKGKIKNVKNYAQSEGFTGIETNGLAACLSPNGDLWFGTVDGLFRFDPSAKRSNPYPPRLTLSQIRLSYYPLHETDYEELVGPWYEIKDKLDLPYYDNDLSFDFAAIDHINPTRVMYQWKLDGSDEDWSPVSHQKTVAYSNIPAGDYVFRVKAANEDKLWSPEIAVAFEIYPPFWQTWWFLIVCIASGLVLLFIGFFLYLRQVKRKAEREKEHLQLEKDLIRLEQKALRLQMNPHFIFNALNSIQGLISRQDAKSARYYLAKFSKLMRMTLENSRSTVIALEDEVKTLENYLSLEQFSSGDKFDFTITVDDSLDPEEQTIPPMMVQPFVENAIIHGVTKLTDRKGHIDVTFKQEDNHLWCEISDNGIGRKAAAEVKSQKANYHKSTALVVTQERLDILHAGAEEVKGLEITDLFDENDNPSGTRVTLRIPLLNAVR